MRICLFQPDIPGNFGSIIRIAACFGIGNLDVIMPCGFYLDDKKIKRSSMDYINFVSINIYNNFDHYLLCMQKGSRLILLSTKAEQNYLDFVFKKDDILVVGSESKGASDEVHSSVNAKIKILMQNNTRSLNVAISLGIVVSESVRQLARK